MSDEIEIKLNLQNEHNYDLLRKRLGPPVRVVSQHNYFFDTENRNLVKMGWALRLRRENAGCLMTLKGPRRTENRCPSIRKEFETAVDCSLFAKALQKGLEPANCPDPIGPHLSVLRLDGLLTTIIDFSNTRTTFECAEPCLHQPIELDITRFPDGSIDYELEMELKRPDDHPVALGQLELLLNELGIPLMIMNDTKFARALNRMNMGHLYRET